MKRLFATILVFGTFGTTALAKSPVGNWQAVEDLPSGWRLAVVTDFTFPCIFVKATDQELVCRVPRSDEVNPQESHVRRGAIREIRVDRRNGANAIAAAGLGGGAGAILGAMVASGARVPYGFGILGTLMGAHAGSNVHLLKGKVIYRADAKATRNGDSRSDSASAGGQTISQK